MHKDKRVEKKKTVVMKRCLNPVFNESFPFDVPAHVLRETTIIITVMDKDRLSRNDVIGKVSIFFPLLRVFLLLVLLFLCVFLTLWQTISSCSLVQSLLTPAGACRPVFCCANEWIYNKWEENWKHFSLLRLKIHQWPLSIPFAGTRWCVSHANIVTT